MRQLAAILTAAGALLGGTGCDELDLEGRLGNGEFQYLCGNGDASCNGTETILGFDLDRDILTIAVGGHFGFEFDDDDATAIVPASSDLVASGGSTYRFTGAGTVDFLAKNDEGRVIDFAPLTSAAPTHLQFFYDGDPVNSLSLERYRDHEIAVAPVTSYDDNPLGGGFTYHWNATGDLNMPTAGDDNTVVVRLSSASTGTITVSTGSMSATINVVAQ